MNKNRIRVVVVMVGAGALAGCGERGAPKGPDTLQIEILQPGSGPAAKGGDTVRVHYTGKLLTGQTFDSSIERGDPLTFTLGAGRVIQGWEEGIAGMKVGEKRRLVIPPHLAYGSRGMPGKIPPDAQLTFEVELMGIE